MITNRRTIDLSSLAPGVNEELAKAADKATAYEQLEKSEGFRLLMDCINGWADSALADLRALIPEADDRTIRALQMRWKERELLIQEIHHELESGKQGGTEAARQLLSNGLAYMAPMTFGNNGEGE